MGPTIPLPLDSVPWNDIATRCTVRYQYILLTAVTDVKMGKQTCHTKVSTKNICPGETCCILILMIFIIGSLHFHKTFSITICWAPPYLIDSFNANTFNHSYSTRNSSKLRIPIARTEYYRRSFLISGCNAWNNLPDYIYESLYHSTVLNSICLSIL